MVGVFIFYIYFMEILKRLWVTLFVVIAAVLLVVIIFSFIWVVYWIIFDRNLPNDILDIMYKQVSKL